MVKISIIKGYEDMELNRKVLPKEILEVSISRAKKLTSMGLAELLSINKLNKEEYYEINSRKKR
jgi:hypothetical protein